MKTFRKELRSLRSHRNNLNVVITGGTRGLGRAFAKEFAKQGDRVFILSRSQKDIDDLQDETKTIVGVQCDVGNHKHLKAILPIVLDELQTIDIWINNAGVSGGARTLLELSDEKVENIVTTNMLGTAIACKNVREIMLKQPQGGAIFNLAGAGSDGNATPNYAIYGATKAGIVQFSKSLQREWKDSIVDLHVVSPGMMLTDLLMDNQKIETLEVINFLCTHPDLVAYHLVPRIKNSYYYKEESYIRFLTAFKILSKLITSKFITNTFSKTKEPTT